MDAPVTATAMPPGPLSTAPTGGDRRQDAGDRPGHGAFSAMVAGRADASAGMLPRLDGAENAGKPTTEPEAAATGADVPGGHSDTPEPDRLIEVAVPKGPASPDAALPRRPTRRRKRGLRTARHAQMGEYGGDHVADRIGWTAGAARRRSV
jgi:hypothetical protein